MVYSFTLEAARLAYGDSLTDQQVRAAVDSLACSQPEVVKQAADPNDSQLTADCLPGPLRAALCAHFKCCHPSARPADYCGEADSD